MTVLGTNSPIAPLTARRFREILVSECWARIRGQIQYPQVEVGLLRMRCVRPLGRHIVGSALQADPPTAGGHRDPLVVGVLLGPAASRTTVLSFPIAIRSPSPTGTTRSRHRVHCPPDRARAPATDGRSPRTSPPMRS